MCLIFSSGACKEDSGPHRDFSGRKRPCVLQYCHPQTLRRGEPYWSFSRSFSRINVLNVWLVLNVMSSRIMQCNLACNITMTYLLFFFKFIFSLINFPNCLILFWDHGDSSLDYGHKAGTNLVWAPAHRRAYTLTLSLFFIIILNNLFFYSYFIPSLHTYMHTYKILLLLLIQNFTRIIFKY